MGTRPRLNRRRLSTGAPLSLNVEQVQCTLMDVFDLAGQRAHEGEYVHLHTKPGHEYHGRHSDRNVQFPCRLMWGNGLTWAVMVTILTDPVTRDNRTTHRVKKFEVPEHIINLLEGLPLSIGFGIKGDVLAIEDTFSLLAGRPVRVSGFVELGSLMLLAGWGLETVNMPATHAVVCGSVLNKMVSRADERWGVKWDDLAESIRVYALGDVKHGYLIWSCVLGCLLWDFFPDPQSVLYLTGLNQAEFVQGFSVFILESLVGTEPHPTVLSQARTREELLRSLRYRRSSGALSERPPARVELLEEMLSPWASVTYGGCRYLRVARAETISQSREYLLQGSQGR